MKSSKMVSVALFVCLALNVTAVVPIGADTGDVAFTVTPANNLYETDSTPVGTKFNITVMWIDIAPLVSVYSWQVKLVLNDTSLLSCTNAWQPTWHGNYLLKPREPNWLHPGPAGLGTDEILLMGTLMGSATPVSSASALLCIFELQILKAPAPKGPRDLYCSLSINNYDTMWSPDTVEWYDPIKQDGMFEFSGSARALNVGPGQPFPTITAALTVAAHGDAIHVWNNPVPYVENPVVSVPDIQIIGQSSAGVTVQAAGPGPCFAITAPNVAIMMLTIVCPVVVGGTFGIYIFPSSSQCRIYRNIIQDFDCGIYIDNSPGNTVMGNEIDNCMAVQGPPQWCSCGVFMLGAGATANIMRGNDFGWLAPNWYQIGTNGASGNTVKFNNFWSSPNMPQAFVQPGDVNTWDDWSFQKGSFWSDHMPKPPYVIDPLNIDHFCSPGLARFNWAVQLFDINRDLKCDILDVSTTARAFGMLWSMPGWNPLCDVSGPTPGVPDGKIDIRDIAFVARNFGWTDP